MWRPESPSPDSASAKTGQGGQAAAFSVTGSPGLAPAERSASRGPGYQEGEESRTGLSADFIGVHSLFRIPRESSGDHPNWLNCCLQRDG